LPNASRAATAKLNAVPAVAVAGAVRAKVAAGPALTVTSKPPVIDAFTVSVAAMIGLPEVLSAALKVPIPRLSVEFAGTVARRSVLVKWTVPV